MALSLDDLKLSQFWQGLGAFYRGFLPAIISMAPNGAVYYTVRSSGGVRRGVRV